MNTVHRSSWDCHGFEQDADHMNSVWGNESSNRYSHTALRQTSMDSVGSALETGGLAIFVCYQIFVHIGNIELQRARCPSSGLEQAQVLPEIFVAFSFCELAWYYDSRKLFHNGCNCKLWQAECSCWTRRRIVVGVTAGGRLNS